MAGQVVYSSDVENGSTSLSATIDNEHIATCSDALQKWLRQQDARMVVEFDGTHYKGRIEWRGKNPITHVVIHQSTLIDNLVWQIYARLNFYLATLEDSVSQV